MNSVTRTGRRRVRAKQLIRREIMRPVGQVVKTSPSHGGIRGSTPLRDTKEKKRSSVGISTDRAFSFFVGNGRIYKLIVLIRPNATP